MNSYDQMRTHLIAISKLADEQYNVEGDYGGKVEALRRITELCATALAIPPRQCDVGMPDDLV